jgi:hypothetical protein
LVIVTLIDSARKWLELLKTDGPIGMNTEIQDFTQYEVKQPSSTQ